MAHPQTSVYVKLVKKTTDYNYLVQLLTEYGQEACSVKHAMFATAVLQRVKTAPVVALANVQDHLPDSADDQLKNMLMTLLTAVEEKSVVFVRFDVAWFETNKALFVAWQFLDQRKTHVGSLFGARVNVSQSQPQ